MNKLFFITTTFINIKSPFKRIFFIIKIEFKVTQILFYSNELTPVLSFPVTSGLVRFISGTVWSNLDLVATAVLWTRPLFDPVICVPSHLSCPVPTLSKNVQF
jgi:hypothetical protein